MQKKKIFIEIEVPNGLKKRLFQRTEKWKNLPIKWSKEKNLYVNLISLGYVDESVLPEICKKINSVAEKNNSFDVYFEKISLGPDVLNPKMIFLKGKINNELKILSEKIEKELDIFKEGKNKFTPHIILGRIRAEKWKNLIEKPVIEEDFNVSFGVENISIMENSDIGNEYISIEECALR